MGRTSLSRPCSAFKFGRYKMRNCSDIRYEVEFVVPVNVWFSVVCVAPDEFARNFVESSVFVVKAYGFDL